jgi:NADH-quinone oxidoreductase subunit M
MLEPFPHFLTVLTFLPLVGALVVRFIGRDSALRIRWVALVFSLLTLVLAILAFVQFDPDTSGFQFSESHPWIASPPINYTMGMDGLSLLLVLLTAFLTPLSVLASWKGITIRVKEFHLFLLALETGMIGVFVSLDLFLFFVFWEVMLIPMYFLIGVWGHERRIYAAVKFILYTMVGSALMLVGILYLYSVTGSFDFQTILRDLPGKWASLPTWLLPAQTWLFLAFFIAFAIKVPMFPFHTWLPDAHVEAPTAGSVILAGVLLKMGTYGMLRFCLPLFPQASKDLAPIVCVVAIIGILYGALVAMVQPDMKKLVAYSSVAHMGFVVLGIFAFNMNGLEGAIYQMCNHGVSTGALFLLVGMLYERRHTRLISEFGGLATSLPIYSTFFMIVALSSLGLPMLNGFVGEFLIIVGAFHARAVYGALAAIGVVLAAVYLLWMYQRVFFGEVTNPKNRDLPDCDAREKLILVSLVLVMLWMGIYPNPFLRRLDRSTLATIERVESTGTQMAGRAPAELPPQRSLRTRRKKDSASSMVSVVNSRSANERAQEGGQSR